MTVILMGPRFSEKRQLESEFIIREMTGANDDIKRPIRLKIAKFFARSQSYARTRCFCLPGVRWAFENVLERHIENPQFIGVERNYTILERGLPWMPGKTRMYTQKGLVDDTIRGWASDRSKVLWCDASYFMDRGRQWFKSGGDHQRWRHQYKLWTCAWLDFSCQIGGEIATCMKRLENHLDARARVVPVAVTFMIGREAATDMSAMNQLEPHGSPLDKRVTYLRAMWESNRYRTAQIVDAFDYHSASGCNMGVVQALLTLK